MKKRKIFNLLGIIAAEPINAVAASDCGFHCGYSSERTTHGGSLGARLGRKTIGVTKHAAISDDIQRRLTANAVRSLAIMLGYRFIYFTA